MMKGKKSDKMIALLHEYEKRRRRGHTFDKCKSTAAILMDLAKELYPSKKDIQEKLLSELDDKYLANYETLNCDIKCMSLVLSLDADKEYEMGDKVYAYIKEYLIDEEEGYELRLL